MLRLVAINMEKNIGTYIRIYVKGDRVDLQQVCQARATALLTGGPVDTLQSQVWRSVTSDFGPTNLKIRQSAG